MAKIIIEAMRLFFFFFFSLYTHTNTTCVYTLYAYFGHGMSQLTKKPKNLDSESRFSRTQCHTILTIKYILDVMLNIYKDPIMSSQCQLPVIGTTTSVNSVAFNLCCSHGDTCPGGDGVSSRSGWHSETSSLFTEVGHKF